MKKFLLDFWPVIVGVFVGSFFGYYVGLAIAYYVENYN